MFEVNDRSLRTVRVILNVWVWVGAIACVICGIVLSALGMIEMGLPILFVGPFACWVSWVFGRLYLSHLCDIKLIRNKLYGVGNKGLDVFLKTKEQRAYAGVQTKSSPNTYTFSAGGRYSDEYAYRQAPQQDKTSDVQKVSSGEEGKPLSMEERTQKLLRLKKLLDAGAITQEEFDRQKAKLLNG